MPRQGQEVTSPVGKKRHHSQSRMIMPDRTISDVTKGPGNDIINLPGCVTGPVQAVMSSLGEEVMSLPDAGHEVTSGQTGRCHHAPNRL